MSKFHEIRSSMRGRFADRKLIVPQVYAEPYNEGTIVFVWRPRPSGETFTHLARLDSLGKLTMVASYDMLHERHQLVRRKFNALLFKLDANYHIVGAKYNTPMWVRYDLPLSQSVRVPYSVGDRIDLDAKYLHAAHRNNL